MLFTCIKPNDPAQLIEKLMLFSLITYFVAYAYSRCLGSIFIGWSIGLFPFCGTYTLLFSYVLLFLISRNTTLKIKWGAVFLFLFSQNNFYMA